MIETTSSTGGRGWTGTDRLAALSARCRAARARRSRERSRRCALVSSACMACASYAPMMPRRTAAELTPRDRDEEKCPLGVDQLDAEQAEERCRRAAHDGRPIASTRARVSSDSSDRRGNDRATLVSNARPCARLARFATGFERNTSDRRSSSASSPGSDGRPSRGVARCARSAPAPAGRTRARWPRR